MPPASCAPRPRQVGQLTDDPEIARPLIDDVEAFGKGLDAFRERGRSRRLRSVLRVMGGPMPGERGHNPTQAFGPIAHGGNAIAV
jgi:hypothetical protein